LGTLNKSKLSRRLNNPCQPQFADHWLAARLNAFEIKSVMATLLFVVVDCKLFDKGGREIARESLYGEDDEYDDDADAVEEQA